MQQIITARRMEFIRRAVFFSLAVLAASPLLAQTQDKPGDPARGAGRAPLCDSCHGAPGGAPLAGMPALAGQQEQFLVLQLILIREGLRDVPQMAGMLKGLSDRDLADVSAHYSRQSPWRSNAKPDAALVARGGEISNRLGCGSCHLKDYSGQQQVPQLTGQREDYLVASLKAYRDDKRSGTDTSMNAVMYKVTDADIQALAHYLAHQ